MPEIVGRLRTPRLASAPSSPAVGEVYYDTATNILYWWNGTTWISAGGGGGADLVYNGSFPTNTPYTDGDIVVSNGIAYLCVRPTNAAPTAWPQASSGSDLVYNGAFPTNTPYVDGDIVIQNGITYLCVRPTAAAPTPWPRANVITSYGTSLPTSPGDGQEAILVDSITNPTYQWHFRYNANSTSAYKWEFVGGSPLTAEVTALESTSSAVYVALATAGPLVILPRAGDYLVEIAALAQNNAAANQVIRMSYDIGATGAVDADCAMFDTETSLNERNHVRRTRLKTGLAAVTLTMKYKGTSGSSAWSDRWMQVTPVRVS